MSHHQRRGGTASPRPALLASPARRRSGRSRLVRQLLLGAGGLLALQVAAHSFSSASALTALPASELRPPLGVSAPAADPESASAESAAPVVVPVAAPVQAVVVPVAAPVQAVVVPVAAPPAPKAAPKVAPPKVAAPKVAAPARARHEVVGAAALAGLPFNPSRVGYSIRFAPGRAGVLGLTDPSARTITVFVRTSMNEAATRRVLAHELGHAVDRSRLSDTDRMAYRATRGLAPATRWFPRGAAGSSDFASGSGDFAEAFAAYWLGSSSWSSELAPAPDAQQRRALATYFRV